MIGKTNLIEAKDFKIGLFTRSDIINANPDMSPNCMNIQWSFDNAIGKRLGSSTTNSITIGSTSRAGWSLDSSNSLSTNLQAYWKLDESSGQRNDQVGGNNLTDVNSTPSIVGIRNQAALMVAANSNYFFRATSAPLQTGNIDFSMSAWIYLNSTSNTVQQTIISKRDPDIDTPTVLLLHCDGTNGSTSFPDSSPSSKTVTSNNGAQVSTAQKEFGTGSCLLDGINQYLSIPDSSDWDFETANFTIDCWVRLNSITGEQAIAGQLQDANNSWWFGYKASTSSWTFQVSTGASTTILLQASDTPSTGIFMHIALVRNGNTFTIYKNGISIGTTSDSDPIIDFSAELWIGRSANTPTLYFDGWIDEVRISKGVARWLGNFTPPGKSYGVQEYEYWLFVNTDNVVTFRVSSSGTAFDGQVRATSMGALNTSTWYNAIAYHSNGTHIAVTVNNLAPTTSLYTSGVRVGSAPFTLGAFSDGLSGFSTNFIDARMDEVGFWKKVLNSNDRSNLYGGGTANTYSGGASGFSWYMFDFGASTTRWLTIAAGTGIVASSNLGATFVTVATSRTQNYQYLDRSRNVVIATSDSYDPTLYWAGSAGTSFVALAVNSAPSAKFSINYQGFLILLNSINSNGTISTRRFSYADENLQLTDTWINGFDLPSSSDDEITGPFILNKFLYVSTKYRIFRLSYTGGNPDWQYIQVKNFGFVPRTIKVFTLKQGQVAVGLDWSRRIRAFDGYDDQIISDNVENDNNYCDFATDKISLFGSGLIVANAEFDPNEQEYRLNVAIGAMSTQTTHAIVLNARTLGMYPYDNQQYNCMCVAESAGKQFLMAADRSGYVHILNSGNLDGGTIPVNEIYDSPILFNKSPSEVTKNRQLNMYFNNDSCGSIYYQDRFDFSTIYSSMRLIRNYQGDTEITGTEPVIQVLRTVDIPSVQNVYQFRLTTSMGTANPWQLNHFDLFNTSLGYGRGK